jgi:putrescine aminotransferase
MEIEGTGHTAVIYTADEALARRFGVEMSASRILVNTPATHGSFGITTSLAPSLTLGCGTFGGNSTTDSVGYRHLLNIKRVAVHDKEKATMFDFMAHVNPTAGLQSQLLGFDVIEAEAEGCIIRDTKGREYLDFLAGVGVMNVGHRHPRVVAAVKAQLDRMPLSSRLLFNGRSAELARLLSDLAPGDLRYTFFCNSGTEAVEAALKLARAARGRPRVVSTINSFHGKTFGSLAASGRDVFKRPFGQMLSGFDHVPFGEFASLRDAMGEDVAAVILEPVQGEGGVRPAPPGYLAEARKLCDAHGALLIFDEVQTGMGRCGSMFACELAGVAPDLMCLAKGLSGGVMPIGAVMGTNRAFRIFEENAYMHSSTFGGNPLACAAGIAALEVIRDERLCEQAREMGEYLMARLQAIRLASDGAISEVRGVGLLIGIEFAEEDIGMHVIANMAKRRVIAAYTLNQPRVIRFEPPLIVTRPQCDQAMQAFEEALQESLATL